MKFLSLSVIMLSGLLGMNPALGQDFSPMADFATARGMSTSQSAAMADVFRNTLGRGKGLTGGHQKGDRNAGTDGEASATSVALARLGYHPTSATMEAAVAAFIERARQSDAKAADATGRALTNQDIGRIYRGIVTPFGLRDDNLADALTAYTILGWMIANDKSDPSPAFVQAVRNQLAVRLASNTRLSNDKLADLGEELKLSFVILQAGWQSARRNGAVPAFADAVTALFGTRGLDLHQTKLTSAGFISQTASR